MTVQPVSYNAYQLIHQGVIALSQITSNGIRINMEYVLEQLKVLQVQVEEARAEFDRTRLSHHWQKVFGKGYNPGSDSQLSTMLYDKMKLEPPSYTEKDSPSVDAVALEALGIPDLKPLLRLRVLEKALSTYFAGIIRETNKDGFLRPMFNLHTVKTYRSSSSNINFQNIPVRDPEIGAMIRGAFIPRPGRRILEVDFGGIEVRIAYCYHKDPTMKEYLLNPEKDMHRDMAMECYLLSPEEMGGKKDKSYKNIRYCGKNKFVFPEFYGSYWKSVATDLWNAIDQMKLVTAQGVPLKKHLAQKGIKNLEQYEKHIEKVEKAFWGKRFPIYTRWKESHVASYERAGFFDTHTGFRCQGVMRKNQVINYPIQGSAFHCLLWSVIQIQRHLRENGMKSLVIGQIHDSVILDICEDEAQDLLNTVYRIMTRDILKEWRWITIPLEVEAEITPMDGSWKEKKGISQKEGAWELP